MEFDLGLTHNVDQYNKGLDYLNGAVECGFDGPDYYRNWYEGGGVLPKNQRRNDYWLELGR